MQLSTSSIDSFNQTGQVHNEDRSGSIKIATWVLLGVTVAVFISRQVTKAIVFRKIALDDFFMLAATVFAIGLFITFYILASEGLGVQGLLTNERANILMKGYYASELIYISSICFSKLSLLVLFYTVVAVQRIHRRLVFGFGVFIFTWSMASLIVIAFQCELPRPWESMTLRCFDKRAFWIVYCITDMSTEISIIMLSINLVADLRISLSRKVAVVTCFAPRTLVAAASIARLVFLYPVTPHNDPKFELWLPVILSELHVCLNICTACVPYMMPFLKSLESSLRRMTSSKSPDFRMDERKNQSSSSLWFRRQKKNKAFDSWESSPVNNLQYQRVPQVSPHIPTPRAMSPLTPPQYHSRPGTARSLSPSQRGLSINIPDRNSPLPRSTDVASPQTASSFALSPSCTSPVALLPGQPFVPTRKAPTPPLKARSPKPPTTSPNPSGYSISPVSPIRPQRFSLFPQQSSPRMHYSPEIQQSGFTPVHVPPIRALRSQGTRNSTVVRSHTAIENAQHRMRSTSGPSPPKFSTAPHPTSAPSTTTSPKLKAKRTLLTPPLNTSPTPRTKHASVQDLSSPMGAAIDNYFNTAAPPQSAIEPPAPIPKAAPFNAHRERNRKILSPTNTLRTPTTPPQPALTHDGFISRDSILMTKMSMARARDMDMGMPTVRDARSSPRIVVREVE